MTTFKLRLPLVYHVGFSINGDGEDGGKGDCDVGGKDDGQDCAEGGGEDDSDGVGEDFNKDGVVLIHNHTDHKQTSHLHAMFLIKRCHIQNQEWIPFLDTEFLSNK